MGGPAAGLLLAGLAVLASPARALLVSPARLPAIRPASGAACGLRMAADPEEPDGASTEETERGSRKKGILWNRVRKRVREDDLKRAPIGESVEVITKEIDQVLASDGGGGHVHQLAVHGAHVRTKDFVGVAAELGEQREEIRRQVGGPGRPMRDQGAVHVDASIVQPSHQGRHLEATPIPEVAEHALRPSSIRASCLAQRLSSITGCHETAPLVSHPAPGCGETWFPGTLGTWCLC